MTCKDIIIEHLKALGAEGLCCTDCGCPIDDIGECFGNDSILDCNPAKRHVVSAEEADEYDTDPGETVFVPL